MNEDELMDDPTLEIPVEDEPVIANQDTGDENDWYTPDVPEPSSDQDIRDQIAELKSLLSVRNERDLSWEEEEANRIEAAVNKAIAPLQERLDRPNEVKRVAAIAAKGLGEAEKEVVMNYLDQQNYSTVQLKALAADKMTMEVLRGYAKSAAQSSPASPKVPASEGRGSSTSHALTAAEDQMLQRDSREIAWALNLPYEEVYKEARTRFVSGGANA